MRQLSEQCTHAHLEDQVQLIQQDMFHQPCLHPSSAETIRHGRYIHPLLFPTSTILNTTTSLPKPNTWATFQRFPPASSHSPCRRRTYRARSFCPIRSSPLFLRTYLRVPLVPLADYLSASLIFAALNFLSKHVLAPFGQRIFPLAHSQASCELHDVRLAPPWPISPPFVSSSRSGQPVEGSTSHPRHMYYRKRSVHDRLADILRLLQRRGTLQKAPHRVLTAQLLLAVSPRARIHPLFPLSSSFLDDTSLKISMDSRPRTCNPRLKVFTS